MSETVDASFRSMSGLTAQRSSSPRSAVGYVVFSCAVGAAAGAAALASQFGLLPSDLAKKAGHAHSIAMVLYVALPALLGGFGALLAPAELRRGVGASAICARLLSLSLVLMIASLLLFFGAAGAATSVWGGLVWCLGAVVMATSVLSRILDSRTSVVSGERGSAHRFSLFLWTQVAAAAGLLFSVPVLAAGLTRALVSGASTSDVLTSFEMPTMIVVLVAALGLASRAFEPAAGQDDDRRGSALESNVGRAVAVAAGVGGPVIWAHAMMTHQALAPVVSFETGLAALCSLTFGALWMSRLWRRAVSFAGRGGVQLLWTSGFFVVLLSGWTVGVAEGDSVHAAVLSASALALFGAFYGWLDSAGRWYPAVAARFQFLFMFAGSILGNLAVSHAGGALQIVSGVAFGLSLLALVVVALGVFLGERSTDGATIAQVAR
ncbi:hypothetical protein J2D73_01495 [Acetobacter sacchari]|uniref:Cytochrome oxidase subunit I profile domain-containing protein n=1 Tax=Acetobacter sacchari TaxID=2661687 RepID=A0ABS3LRE5_9PROT|nr:hypothetical protein [Acetobacter sacchari]MBO1358474.1 hypothetical protein [Acetobacter sacchari]